MTDEQKLNDMGARDYSGFSLKPIKICVNDIRGLSYPERVPYVIDSSDSTVTGLHGTNCCMTVKMVADKLNIPYEIHFVSDKDYAIDYCNQKGIKVISQSLTSLWTPEYLLKVKQFQANGGIVVNSSGNQGNEETDAPTEYFVSVGTVFNRDNGGSNVVGHSGWSLPQIIQGADNIFTDTSSTTPVIAAFVALIVELFKLDFDGVNQFLYNNSYANYPNIETGERFFIMPEIKKTEIKMEIGGKAYVNGVEKTLDVPAQIISGRTLVPFRFIGENLGCVVDYKTDSITGKVSEVSLTKYGI